MKMGSDVGSYESVLPQSSCCGITCEGVQTDSEQSCRKGRMVLGKQASDDARQDVATTGCAHAAVAPAKLETGAFWSKDTGGMALQDKVCAVLTGEILGTLLACHTLVFCRMRSENAASRQHVEEYGREGKGVESISIDDTRHAVCLSPR